MNSLPAFRMMRRIHRSSCLPTIVWCRGSEFRRRGDGYNHHFVLAAIIKFSVETAATFGSLPKDVWPRNDWVTANLHEVEPRPSRHECLTMRRGGAFEPLIKI